MTNKLKDKIGFENIPGNKLFNLELSKKYSVKVYPNSINEHNGIIYFIANDNGSKYLFVVASSNESDYTNFNGDEIPNVESPEKVFVKRCPLTSDNSKEIQKRFEFTNPILLGKQNSFGFGDRLGLANPAHIRSLEKSNFNPIIAQQSIRELTRTNRQPSEVMSAAVWAVFQEGYKEGFGSDADHLKTTQDIDLMISNGFTMFTFDPGDHVVNEADEYTLDKLEEETKNIDWDTLQDSYESLMKRYTSTNVDLGDGFEISTSKEIILRALVKYGASVAHIYNLYKHLETNYSHLKYEIEISVDETESVTTPFEHYFMSSELNRLGVKIVSLAPRFVGSFEKGIDYKGDIDKFKEEYLKHLKVAEYFGSYKISLHSGSDKFDVYAAIGSLKRGNVHVKTAGTSYLEAVKVIATKNIPLFRQILDFSRNEYMKEKESYHVSANVSKVKKGNEYSDNQLLDLFHQNDARQVLHVTFGKVLTAKDDLGNYLFRDEFMECIRSNEELHYKYIYEHFRKHLKPFEVNSNN